MRLAPIFALLSLVLSLAGCSLPSLEGRTDSQAVAADTTGQSRLGLAVQQLRSSGHDAALTGIYALEKEGILATGNERKWGRTYYARAVLDRLNQLPLPPHQRPR